MVTLLFLYLFRIVIFVKMRGSVGQECVLNVTLVCAGHISTSHGECYWYQRQCDMLKGNLHSYQNITLNRRIQYL